NQHLAVTRETTHMRTHTHMHTQTHTHTHTHTQTPTHNHSHIHIHIHTYIHRHTYALFFLPCTLSCFKIMCAYEEVHHTHVLSGFVPSGGCCWRVRVSFHACTYDHAPCASCS